MTNETIQIPQRRIVEAKPFYASRTDEALKNCKEQGYEALYMPEILDARIGIYQDDPENAMNYFMFKNWFKASSIKATGRTKQRKEVVVYAHIPNYFSNVNNITAAIIKGLRNGAGEMPQEEFQRLYDMKDDNLVFVVSCKELRNSASGIIKLKDAIKHPQTIPFCGGKERAEEYLQCHEKVYGNRIGIWHSDDLRDEPFGRLLIVGVVNGGLDGDNSLDYCARFLGVRSGTGEACARKIFPHQERLAEIIKEYVAPINQKDVTTRVNALYT